MLELRKMDNNGQYHVFLGDPMSSGIDKTVVEPGNAFSPGLWTLGVSLAVKNGGEIISPETRQLPLSFKGGRPPITVSEYDAGGAHVVSELCQIGGAGWQGASYFRADIRGDPDDICVVVRDIGPAGGKISSMLWLKDERALLVNGTIKLIFESHAETRIYPADGEFDSPMALVKCDRRIRLAVMHGYADRAAARDLFAAKPLPVDAAFEKAQAQWDAALPARLIAPDPRISDMWEQSAYHMIAAMECGLPRIGAGNYPVFWMRDCVIVLRALDLIGRSDLARAGCDYLKPLIFSGGFGAESDNPGEGIWALVNHAIVTDDSDWLRGAFPFIGERVEWIERMLNASEPIFRASDSRSIFGQYSPASVLLCHPREGNHIHGRMDWHSPDFYINCWAYSGLKLAAAAAKRLGEPCAAKWEDMAAALDKAIESELLPDFGNDRDSCVAPYPCRALGDAQPRLKSAFFKWYNARRLTSSGERIPEALWTYFEAAQIHNAILLGEPDSAWACLNGYLSDGRWKGMSVFIEGMWGATEMLPYGSGKYGRGWLRQGSTGSNMPHNWTTSETLLMLRSILVTENDDGLSLLSGVPDAWLTECAQFGVKDMPTNHGMLSFTATSLGGKRIRIEFERGADIPYTLGRKDLEVVR